MLSLKKLINNYPFKSIFRKQFSISFLFIFLAGFLSNNHSFAGLNSWTQAPGTQNNEVFCIVVDTTTPGRIFAGSWGVYRSADYGTTWTYSNYSIGSSKIDLGSADMAIDPTNPNVVYAGFAANYGPFKSIDGGISWFQITNELSMAGLHGLLIDSSNISKMYAGGSINGSSHTAPFFISTDTGYHWQKSISGLSTDGIYCLKRHPTRPGVLYAGGDSMYMGYGFYISQDSGTSWRNIPLNDIIGSIAIDPIDPNILYAGSWSGNGIYKSFDGGINWLHYTSGISTTGIIVHWINDIIIHPVFNNIVYISTAGFGIMKSRDYGVTWAPMNVGLGKLTLFSLAYDSVSNTLYAGTFITSGFDTPAGLWMYRDTDVGPPPVAIEQKQWQFYE